MFSGIIFWTVLLVGLVTSSAFLVIHRPRYWFRARAINAVGWVFIIWALYLRATIVTLLAHNHVPHFDNFSQMVTSDLAGALIDLLLILRFITFLEFKRRLDNRNTWVKN